MMMCANCPHDLPHPSSPPSHTGVCTYLRTYCTPYILRKRRRRRHTAPVPLALSLKFINQIKTANEKLGEGVCGTVTAELPCFIVQEPRRRRLCLYQDGRVGAERRRRRLGIFPGNRMYMHYVIAAGASSILLLLTLRAAACPIYRPQQRTLTRLPVYPYLGYLDW